MLRTNGLLGFLGIGFGFALSVGLVACDSSVEDGGGAAAAGGSGSATSGGGGAGAEGGAGGAGGSGGTGDTGGGGAPALDANAAWPDAPSGVPALDVDEILAACAVAGACSPEVMALGMADRLGLVDLCVANLVFSAERAIPMSAFAHGNERPEVWVGCIVAAGGDCTIVSACGTERHEAIACDEDGCEADVELAVSCDGAVATLDDGGATSERDCARAYAECSIESPTGCTDRLVTACPAEWPSSERTCDGDVLLGCDADGHVTWHDCARLGGVCEADGCAYPGADDPDCPQDAPLGAGCSGSDLSACVNGVRVTYPAAGLCQP